MSDLSKRISALSAKQYELLMRRLSREQAEPPALRLVPQPRTTNSFPLSYAQQRLWFLDQIAPDSAAYHVSSALRLNGSLDLAALQHSLNAVVRRHEILRTTFIVDNGQPVQLISPKVALPLLVVELQGLPEHERAAQLRQLVREVPQHRFDLAQRPAIRAILLRLSATEHVLLLTMHHIVSDQWSMALFLQEVTALYTARIVGRPSSLPQLPIQYADFASWQRRWLAGAVLESQLGYWRRALTDRPELLMLPIDHPRPAVQTFRGALRTATLPAATSEAIAALSRQEGTTLFMTLLSAFKVLLAHYTGQVDLVVGSPIAGRTRAETAHLIGFFVNTLVLRSDLSGNPRFRELLRRVREVALEAYAHQDLPFEQLVEAMQPKRDLSYTPLVQVVFAMQNVRMPTVELPKLTLKPLALEVQTAKFDLTLELAESPRGLVAALEYNSDLFDATTIARMLGHLLAVLGSIAADPDRRLDDLRLLTAAEQHQLLVEWNDTAAGIGGQGSGVGSFTADANCLHQLIEAQAKRTPDAVALVFDRGQGSGVRDQESPAFSLQPSAFSLHLTYRELNARANQLAHYLQERGVGPDVCVALCLPRSLDLVIGLLGVLFAGGAYVPLDPASPAERLAFMLEDSRAQVLITTSGDKETKRQGDKEIGRLLVSVSPDLRISLSLDLRVSVSPCLGSLAYVIYTSGSTGTPKGVAVSHAGLLNLIAWHQRAYQIVPADRATQLAGVAFDAAGWELWPYLALGASVHLPDAATLTNPQSLQRWLIAQAITISFLPTPLAEVALTLAWPRVGGLRYLLTGGDQLHRYPAAAVPFTFLNHYGPTEATVVTSATTIAGTADQSGTPPIGRPIANTQIYLLDRALRPVPIGVAGEVFIGGVGLARGYHQQPTLTAERFVPNPFAEVSGSGYRVLGAEASDTRYPAPDTRLYKTGDLARYRPDGSVEYLGRRDQQVKLRGLRIELGEIEAGLAAHPAVREVAVLLREDHPGDKRLVAYVVQGSGVRDQGAGSEDKETRRRGDKETEAPVELLIPNPRPLIPELRAFLRERLPDYMLPSAFVLLEQLPLTPNGKIDRRALPAPDAVQQASDGALALPQTPVEELLSEIWRDLLHHEQIGVHDNFFDLGGHSLLATQLVARVRETFQSELSLHQLFDAPTIAGLAEHLTSARGNRTSGQVPPLVRVERRPQPLSFAQQRLWFFDQLDPGSAVYTIPTAVLLSGPLDIGALKASLDTVMHRHESLRTTFTVVDGQPMQQLRAASCHLPIADLQALPTTERERLVQRLALAETQRPFDLVNGPLLHMLLLRVEHLSHVLILTMHHIVSDGWSMGVLAREISASYAAQRVGTPEPLPELPIQYADFASWQRQWLQGAVLESQLGYWRRQLADLPQLELPADHPHPPSATFQAARQLFQLAPTLHAAVIACSRAAGVTLFMTLLAAFQTLLSRYAMQDDIAVGSPIANRTRAELEPLIGFFVNTLVLRTDLSGNPTFRALLQRVRAMTLDAYAHQDLPFEKLVEELQPERDLSSSPLFQVMFVMQNIPVPSPNLVGLTARPLALPGTLAKFDLTLEVLETAQGLSASMEYKTALFDAPTISRMQHHFQVLLEACAAAPDTPITRLPLLTPAEQHQLLVDWNATAADYPRDTAVHQLIEAQVERTPDMIAVLYEDQQITYRELNARADQLAHALRSYGVDTDALVALSMERAPEMIIAILGIHKAGAAYVPLDPTYPAERLAFMLEDSRAKVLITTSGDKETKRPGDKEIGRLRVSVSPDLRVSVSPCLGSLAYVIYTSGSTGVPKGVMVTQRGLLNLCYGLRAFFSDPAVQHTGLITSISFDISVNQIFPTLLFGRTLHIIPDAVKYDSLALLPYIAAHQIELLDGVPSYFQLVLQAHAPARIRTALRYLLIGGEKIEARLRDAIFDQLGPQVALVNIYGLTEITDINAFALHTAADRAAPITVGRPLQNNQIYILDHCNQPLPIGLVGEVCIAGESLARGYLGRPDLTAERFVPNPFAEVSDAGCQVSEDKLPDTRYPTPATRLYRTGDLARYRPNGMIEILGRLDHQVKLRGHRIEVSEIEAVLGMQPFVRECAVVVREDHPGDKRLVAYVVQGSGSEDKETRRKGDKQTEAPVELLTPDPRPLIPDLRDYLRQTLPNYMIPAVFVLLEQLPRTPNGKIDRRALLDRPPPAGQEADDVAPRTPAEQLMASIWSDLLRVERLGIHANFFALGGHSLLATQLIARMRHAFQVELPLRTIFELPTIAGLTEYIERSRGSLSSQYLPPIQPVPRTGALPLSFAQQRLWFLDQLQPGESAYHIPMAVRLSGQLKLAALAESLDTIILRHEALRTTFAMIDDQPVQLIAPARGLRLTELDLRALADDRRQVEMQRQAAAESQRPFDLTQAPLLRATLLQLAPQTHILLLTLHHIVFDGWSVALFIEEMIEIYAAAAAGTSVSLPALPIQYADFAVWQRQWFQGAVLEAQLAYWRQQLAGAPAALELPTDRPRPPIQTHDGELYTIELPTPLSEGLNRLSQRADATLFMTLLAAFQTLLFRYTGQADIVVGAPIANRTRMEIEPLIGFFVNTLALRTDLAGNPTFQQLLARVREVCLGAYAHQDLPFEKLVEELQPRRDLSRQPVFQVMFSIQPAALPAQERAGLHLAPVLMHQRAAKFDLSLSISANAQQITSSLEYNTTLFDAPTITRMAGHLRVLLQGIVADPTARLATLPLLSQPERHQLLSAWNNTAAAYPPDRCILDEIEAQAVETPDAVAVVYEDMQLTYQELDQRANRLAQYLRRLGVGPEARVSICMDRSLELVVGLIGILKAGAAYLPLDPAYPLERLRYMLADSQARVLITHQSIDDLRFTIDDLGESDRPIVNRKSKIVNLGADWPVIAQASARPPTRDITADQLAYVIYTSGSTGWPKGAMNTHRGIYNRLRWMQDAYQLAASDRVLQKTPFSFDVSVWEFFWPLMTGAALVVARPDGHKDGAYLVQLIARSQITTLHFVPSMLEVFLEQPGLEACRSLKRVICSGEALPAGLQQRFFTHMDAELHNLYGPTEAAVDVTFWACERAQFTHSVPIGRPVANTQIYILDPHFQHTPIGVPGELFIGGVQLARGYLGRPDLTAARFVPNPFGDCRLQIADCRLAQSAICNLQSAIGTRLYKTGDLARYHADGSIEFLGRIDHQVKIRGFRIELGEIETALRQHPLVRDCVLLAREDLPNDTRLVAYVVQGSGIRDQGSGDPTPNLLTPDPRTLIPDLRALLQTTLPAYMIPAAFVCLEALPLTSNGKIDRRALPAPDLAQAARSGDYIAPRDMLELQLVQIWEDVLSVRPVGVTDSFFSFGGHSLMAVRLMSRIQQRFAQTLPLAVLFQSPTVEHLARLLRQQAPAPQRSPLVGIQPNGSKLPFFCVHPSTGNVLCYSELARHLGDDLPFYGLQSIGLDEGVAPDERIETMATHYIEALRTIQPEGPYRLGGWSMGGTVAFEMAQQLHAQGQAIDRLILIDTVAYADALLAIDDTLLLVDLARDLGLELERQDLSIADLRCQTPTQQLLYVLEQARKVHVLPLDLELSQIQRLFTVYKLNIHAMVSYIPQAYPGRISLLRASNPLPQLPPDRTLGWGARARAGVEIYTVPGNHYTLFTSANVRYVAEQISACLEMTDPL